jgi:hypothetical protein
MNTYRTDQIDHVSQNAGKGTTFFQSSCGVVVLSGGMLQFIEKGIERVA